MIYTTNKRVNWAKWTLDPQGRYRSYDHIHDPFKNRPKVLRASDKDCLALRLFCYLSSWGMLRNSFLMQKDYTFLIPIIDILADPQYDFLQDIDPYAPTFSATKYSAAVLQLKGEIRQYILKSKYAKAVGKKLKLSPITSVTDTLISKIILGTLSCVVAYDKNVKNNLRKIDPKLFRKYEKLDKTGLDNLLQLVDREKTDILVAKNDAKVIFKCDYSVMRVLDMLLW